jgi:hypothetical protein
MNRAEIYVVYAIYLRGWQTHSDFTHFWQHSFVERFNVKYRPDTSVG